MPANRKIIYCITPNEQNGGEPKNYWTRVGVAFQNRDGSLNLKLDLLPMVQLQVRDEPEKKEG